jgi:multiple sugar transport system substrate-binding protein
MDQSRPFRIAVRSYDAFEQHLRENGQIAIATAGSQRPVEVVPLGIEALHDALFTRRELADGSWDAALLCSDWLGEAAAKGLLRDLAPDLRRDPPPDFPHGWCPSLLRLQQVGPAVLGMPFHDGPECLIYRRDLFEDPAEQARFLDLHGTPLAVPTTWEDLHRVARFFTRPSEGLWGTIIAGHADGHNTVYDTCLQIWSRGGEAFAPDGRPRLNSPEAIAGLEFLRRLQGDTQARHPESPTADSVRSGQAFARGEVALMVNWFGFAALGDADPTGPTAGRSGIARIPSSLGGAGVSLNVYWLLGVPAGAQDPALSWAFLRHCASPAADRDLTLRGAIGCRRSTWTDPQILARTPSFAHLEALHEVARELPAHPDFAAIARVIDALSLSVAHTEEPIADLCHRYQAQVTAMVESRA